MSTITKELAKLFRKITNSEIDAEGNAHVVLSPADSLLINNARIALASLEAEVAYFINRVKHSDAYGDDVEHLTYCTELDALKSKEDFGGEIVAVYTAPPAPVSVPDDVLKGLLPDAEKAEFWFEHNGKILFEGVKFNNAVFDACRAAMLQGAEPVKNHDELREKVRREHAEWSQATFGDVGPVGPLKHLSKEALEAAAEPRDLSEWADMQFLLWDAQRRAGISDGEITAAMEEKLKVNMARQWPEPKDGEPRLHIKAAPQQEVTQALAKGMERYGDAMQKLADSGD